MSEALEFELSDGDRRHLVDMLRSPGYRVLDRIARAYVAAARETAIAASATDPLGNKDDIANKWAYVMMAEQFHASLNKGVEFEIAVLQRTAGRPTQKADSMARLRRQFQVLGELDEPPTGE